MLESVFPYIPIHFTAHSANNKIRRQENEKHISHRYDAGNSHCHCAVLQYVKQFTKKSKTCLCKQNRRHHNVTKFCSVHLSSTTQIVYKNLIFVHDLCFLIVKIRHFKANIEFCNTLCVFAKSAIYKPHKNTIPPFLRCSTSAFAHRNPPRSLWLQLVYQTGCLTRRAHYSVPPLHNA